MIISKFGKTKQITCSITGSNRVYHRQQREYHLQQDILPVVEYITGNSRVYHSQQIISPVVSPVVVEYIMVTRSDSPTQIQMTEFIIQMKTALHQFKTMFDFAFLDVLHHMQCDALVHKSNKKTLFNHLQIQLQTM